MQDTLTLTDKLLSYHPTVCRQYMHIHVNLSSDHDSYVTILSKYIYIHISQTGKHLRISYKIPHSNGQTFYYHIHELHMYHDSIIVTTIS